MCKKLVFALSLFILVSSLLGLRFNAVEVKASNGYPVHNLNTGLNYTTIQEAIIANETLGGHTIFVEEGIYYENVVVNKSISLIGENKNTTTIDSNKTADTTVIYLEENNISIRGFTIKNGAYEFNNVLVRISDLSSYNNISDNNLLSSRYGIWITGTINNTIIGNYFADIRNECGVIVFGGGNNTIEDNVMNFTGQEWGAWTGITIFSEFDRITGNNRILNNYIIGPERGIFLVQCHGNIVENNTIEDVGEGIFLGYSSHNIIAGNKLSQIGSGEGYIAWQGNQGINLFHSSDNLIINNNISMKGIPYGYAVAMISSSNNTLQGNTIGFAARGIGLFNLAKDNEIKYNSIVSSKEYGAILHNSENNTIHHNNFINNTRQAYDDSGKDYWNFTNEGNYWSDYQGDTNYSIYPKGIDYHPFTNQLPLEHPTVPPQEFVPSQPPVANWYHINYNDTWENEIINLSYLRIFDGGSLTLRNVTLLFDEFPDRIEVKPGCSLYIYDSNITSAGSGCGFTFDVSENSIFEMKNSELHGCGFQPHGGEWGGLSIRTKNATIENNLIADCGGGIAVKVMENGTFVPLGDTSVYVINNTIMDCYEPIHLAGSEFDANHVANNTIVDCIWRFLLDEWNSEMKVSSITHNSAIIEWETYLISDSIVEYGLTDAYDQVKSNLALTNGHSIQLTGLSPNTSYHFRVKSTDFLNHTLFSSDYTFTTCEKYTLTINSLPTGVAFAVDSISHTTPWSGTYSENTSVSLEMPEIHTVGGVKHFWDQWSNGNSSRSRIITMNTNVTLTAYYTGPYYELTVTSSPITGITFTINGTLETTPYTELLLEGSCTLEMPESHDKYVWSHWLEDGDPNRIKTVTVDTNTTLTAVFTPDTAPPTISIISPENKTYSVEDVPFTFTVNESTSWIGYSLDDQTNVTINENTTLTNLFDGTHYAVVYANDTLGNMGISNTVYFTVDTTPPNITDISQTPPENNVLPEDKVKINATVTDYVSEVRQVTLKYTNGNGTWIPVDMTKYDGNVWNATIPAFPYCTNVTYVIIAEDNAHNSITTEEMEYDTQYHVIPEFPSFLILPLFMIATLLAVLVYRRKHSM